MSGSWNGALRRRTTPLMASGGVEALAGGPSSLHKMTNPTDLHGLDVSGDLLRWAYVNPHALIYNLGQTNNTFPTICHKHCLRDAGIMLRADKTRPSNDFRSRMLGAWQDLDVFITWSGCVRRSDIPRHTRATACAPQCRALVGPAAASNSNGDSQNPIADIDSVEH